MRGVKVEFKLGKTSKEIIAMYWEGLDAEAFKESQEIYGKNLYEFPVPDLLTIFRDFLTNC